MLAGAVLGLADRGHAVTVVARSRTRLDVLVAKALAAASPGAVHPLSLDYGDDAAFMAGLEEAVSARGPLLLAICWIHGEGSPALAAVAGAMATGTPAAAEPGAGRPRLIELRGSAVRDPSAPRPSRDAAVRRRAPVRHEVVLLGYMPATGVAGARWLTDDEIVRGVLDAVDRPAPVRSIGVVEPWSGRPGGDQPSS